MVKSMTGFGKATTEYHDKKIVIEIRSLNSKQLDINLKLSNLYREKDIEIRNMIKEALERGKVDMSVYIDYVVSDKEVAINRVLVEQYFKQMLEVSSSLDIMPDKNELLKIVMRFPDTLKVQQETLDEEEWDYVKTGIGEALNEINKSRIQEGDVLIRDILDRIEQIKSLANEVPQFEGKRVDAVRQRLQEKIAEWSDIKNIDQNRMEQEIIYYLEKLDITEEKVRLFHHCSYFIETAKKEEAPGRKLGFITQEIGREINTMGSKANDYDIQKLVVRMKDEVEKIKEQLLNIL